MSQTTQVTLPADLVQTLEHKAKAMSLDLPAYLQFLKNVADRQLDPAFVDATKYTFSRFPGALRKLAE